MPSKLKIFHSSKDPSKLFMEDVNLAREAMTAALKLVDARMAMVEKVDKHPLSWPVATEYQKMKRARSDDAEDDKLFAAAEKKVKEDRQSRSEEAKAKASNYGKQRLSLQSRPSTSYGRSGNVGVQPNLVRVISWNWLKSGAGFPICATYNFRAPHLLLCCFQARYY